MAFSRSFLRSSSLTIAYRSLILPYRPLAGKNSPRLALWISANPYGIFPER